MSKDPLALVQVIHSFFHLLIRSLSSIYYVLDIWMGSEDKVMDQQHFCHLGATSSDLWGSLASHASIMNNFDVSTEVSLAYWLIHFRSLRSSWEGSNSEFNPQKESQCPLLFWLGWGWWATGWPEFPWFYMSKAQRGPRHSLRGDSFFFWSMFCDSSLQFINHCGHACTTNCSPSFLRFQRNPIGLGNLLTRHLHQNTNSPGS